VRVHDVHGHLADVECAAEPERATNVDLVPIRVLRDHILRRYCAGERQTEQFWSTGKLQLVGETGTVDSVNVTFFIQVVGGEVTNIKDFDFGTCEEPA
jgi:hypothetical protein